MKQFLRSGNITSVPRSHRYVQSQERFVMLKFLASTVGIIFIIGLIVVIGLLMLIF